MITVETREQIRRAYFIEHQSIRQIARELHCSRRTAEKALASAEPAPYIRAAPRPAPVLGPHQSFIEQCLRDNELLPAKQRYTAHKIFGELQKRGYAGAESSVRGYIARQRRSTLRRPVFLPLEFDPGADAQADWGEAEAIIAGRQLTVQVFIIRLCFSRRLFVMAFPSQRQEAFFAAHVQAFQHFGGVPQRITYDNLTTAVKRVLEGHNREEQAAFIVFRSHYLFASNFCTPGEGHEKGGVEHSVGFARRNFLVPLPRVASFAELNAQLLAACLADDARQVKGQPSTIAAAWQQEQPYLRALPKHEFACCITRPVTLTPYSQVVFETNRYSVPVEQAYRHLVLRAFPFRIEVLHLERVITSHERCYEREQDIFDPLHYLPLLEQRPAAFEHAKPLRRWREGWPPVYEQLLAHLCAEQAAAPARGIREFVRILRLLEQHPAEALQAAISQALACGCVHLDGVQLCLRALQQADTPLPPLDLSKLPELPQLARLAALGAQSVDLGRYEQLLSERPLVPSTR
jgi:transposase